MSDKGISRRTFLGGSAAAVAAVALGTWQVESNPRIAHRLGLADSPDRTFPGSGAAIRTSTFRSRHMNREVSWSYAMPAAPPIATVFSLHGRSGNHTNTFDEVHFHDAIAELQLPLAIASVDGGDHNFWHPRADGTDAMAMLVEEFVPMVEDITKTSQRALIGWSMGGYGAILASATYTDMFKGVAALSPALWANSSQTAEGAYDSAEDFNDHNVFAKQVELRGQRIYVACGKGDPFFMNSRTFAMVRKETRANFGDGFHDAAYWRSVAPEAFRFLSDSITA